MEDETGKTTGKLAMGFATGWVVLRHRPYRRNLLFISTLITLGAVFAGAVPLARPLAERPVGFFLFWVICFMMVGFVLLLAFYDLLQIRKEHKVRMDKLDRELADAAAEARRIARENLEQDKEKEKESE